MAKATKNKAKQGNTEYYDIVIVGGGIVGLTMANCLLDSGLSVAVIEKNKPQPVTDEIDLRVSAINGAASQLFEQLGMWKQLEKNRISVFHNMHVWDSTGTGEIDFESAQIGVPALGHILENSVILKALRENIKQADKQEGRISLLCPASIERIALNESTHAVMLEDGSAIDTTLIIGADGCESIVRQAALIDFQRKSYEQKGVVATVTMEKSHDKTARQCFLPSGPLAFLPLANENKCSIVWSLDEEKAAEVMLLNDDDFSRQLEQAFDYKLGAVNAVSRRAAFPLTHGHAMSYVQDGLALIGDAAHIIHPLAGQGANLGIMDASCLADVIKSAHENGRQWNAFHTLRRYERQRKGDNLLMEASMTGFKALFGSDNPLLTSMRNGGLNLVDHLPIVKNQFIQHALGLH